MESDRLTALTDGVTAVIITIMVLELKPPHGADVHDLVELWPTFLSFALSFLYVAIYWNNHHHFFKLLPTVNGTVMWANLNLLFWLSLIPSVERSRCSALSRTLSAADLPPRLSLSAMPSEPFISAST